MTLESWHLSKTLTISLIVAIASSAFTSIWWISKLDSRVDRNDQRITAIEIMKNDMSAMREDIAIIKTILKYSDISMK